MTELVDLRQQYEEIREEIDAAVQAVVRSGRYILGPEVAAFEEEAAAFLKVKHAIGVANGSDALFLAFLALGIGPGDEVVVPSFTFFATAGSASRAGAAPVFADILPDTFNLDPQDFSSRTTARTKAVVPVHLYGQPANMQKILEIARNRGLYVVEDAAQAFGARYRGEAVGTLGDIGCFSFFPSKNLGCYGDGGLVTTNDDDLARELRLLRVHGSQPRYYHHRLGINSRLDEIQAAVLRVKLRHLDRWNDIRKRLAAAYDKAFAGTGICQHVVTPAKADDCDHIYHQYTIRVPSAGPKSRDGLQVHLRERGIASAVYYPLPLHLQPAFAGLRYREGELPMAEAAAREVLSLPIYAGLKETSVRTVVGAVKEYFRGGHPSANALVKT